MPRRKLEDRNIRKVKKTTRGSYSFTAPIEFIRELKWRDNQKVVMELDRRGGRIIIKDWKK